MYEDKHKTEQNLGSCPRIFIMLTATLPGSNVLQNTFCCLLLAVLRQKDDCKRMQYKNTLEIKREKTRASISGAIKRETPRHSIPPHEQASNEMFLAKSTDSKFDKACIYNHQFIGNKGDRQMNTLNPSESIRKSKLWDFY